MVSLIPPPDPRELLPPLLASLPTAFVSARPPPALLPLLSPILRQRLQLLTPSNNSQSDSWLHLLCWDRQKAEELASIVEKSEWEPHPVSGQIEMEDVANPKYKRFDEETLRAVLPVAEFGLTVFYLWCTSEQEGNGWRVAEVTPYKKEHSEDATWTSSIFDADTSSPERIVSETIRDAEDAEALGPNGNVQISAANEDAEDDDDYWNQYDRTPGPTPGPEKSPVPHSIPTQSRATEDDYYSRYADVQPALDGEDPSEEKTVQDAIGGESTLNGNAFTHLLQRQTRDERAGDRPVFHEDEEDGIIISQPQPQSSRSPSSSGVSDTVDRLEQTAAAQSDSEVAVRQHVSTTMKSMYRLARCTGMDREEFVRICQRELEVLELLD